MSVSFSVKTFKKLQHIEDLIKTKGIIKTKN